MGGTNLTNIKYLTIGNLKFIDTMKYYLTSLGKLATPLNKLRFHKKIKRTKQMLQLKSNVVKCFY